MSQKYRIYINDNTLLIADKMPKQQENLQQLDAEGFEFLTFYKNLKKSRGVHYVLLHNKPKEVFLTIKKKLTVIKAAGGLVENNKGEFLFIYRNKKWDLPKGKVEKGENLKVTAVREVEEECGVEISKRGKLLCKTYHIYEMNASVILKRTNWYKMKVKGAPKLVPQKEEGITSAVWVDPNQIETKIKNTYPLIIEVLTKGKLLQKS